MKPIKRWVCPSCNMNRRTPYCSNCGEEPLRARDLTWRDVMIQLFNTFTDVDRRLIQSFRLFFAHPGALTVAHLNGQRRGYLGPLSLFLIANALFFGMQSIANTNIFSPPLESHLNQQDWRDLASQLVSQHLLAKQMTLAAYSPIFDSAATLNAKSLIILMTLSYAPFLAFLFAGSRRPFGAHLVFALHTYVFVLLLFCVSLLIVEINLLLGGRGLLAPGMDLTLSIFNLAICGGYIYLALGAVYGSRGFAKIAKTILLSLIIAAFVPGYRFVIFLVTLQTT